MKKQIKDSFDQIHAPQALINDTKRKVHQAQLHNQTPVQPKRKLKNITRTVCALAASVVLMITGYNFFISDSSFLNGSDDSGKIADIKEPSDSFHGADHNSIHEFAFEGTKQLNDWYQLLKKNDLKGEERIQLDDNYVIFSFGYPREEDEYQIDIVIKGGELYLENSILCLQGDFQAKVYHQGKQLAKTSLNITSSCQFTSTDTTIDLQDVDRDGQMDFYLETKHSGENDDNFAWFTLQQDGNIVELEN